MYLMQISCGWIPEFCKTWKDEENGGRLLKATDRRLYCK
jgi:hypothetical protein